MQTILFVVFHAIASIYETIDPTRPIVSFYVSYMRRPVVSMVLDRYVSWTIGHCTDSAVWQVGYAGKDI
jgi:hypothetical protein